MLGGGSYLQAFPSWSFGKAHANVFARPLTGTRVLISCFFSTYYLNYFPGFVDSSPEMAVSRSILEHISKKNIKYLHTCSFSNGSCKSVTFKSLLVYLFFKKYLIVWHKALYLISGKGESLAFFYIIFTKIESDCCISFCKKYVIDWHKSLYLIH